MDDTIDTRTANQKRSDSLREHFRLQPRSAETRAKLSAAKTGRTMSEETKRKIAASVTGFHHTAATRAKMSANRVGKTHTEAHTQAAAQAHWTPEARAALAERMAGNTFGTVLKGRKRSPETIAKIKAALNRPETRQRLSAAHIGNQYAKGHSPANKGIPHSPEQRAKLRAAWKPENHQLSDGARAAMSLQMKGNQFAKGYHHTEEARRQISEGTKGHPAIIAARARQKFPFNNSMAECAVQSWLASFGVPYETHFIIDGIRHAFDIAIPSYATLIEVDGCFWHRCPLHCPDSPYCPDSTHNDTAAQKLGWAVSHLWQHDIPLLIHKESSNAPTP